MNEETLGSNPDNSSEEDVFGSTGNFFDALEAEVNSAVTESEETKQTVTPPKQSDPVKETRTAKQEGTTEQVDWEKRYKDSTREAQRLNAQLKEHENYVPILDAMKKDRGLVDHVKDYLQGNVKQKSMKEQLNLDEDFIYDPNEAMTDPSSDSAKLFNAHLAGQVTSKVAKAQDIERRRGQHAARKVQMETESKAFKEKHKMSDENFESMMEKAKTHKMSLDDIHYLINRDQASANIATNTKKEMLEQMKNVRDIPTSAADVNSAKVEQKLEDEVFDALKGSDGDLEDLFGSS